MRLAAIVLALAALAGGAAHVDGRHRRGPGKLLVFGDTLSTGGERSAFKDGGYFARIRSRLTQAQRDQLVAMSLAVPNPPDYGDTYTSEPGTWPMQLEDDTGITVINYAFIVAKAAGDYPSVLTCNMKQELWNETGDLDCVFPIPGLVSQVNEYMKDVRAGRQPRLGKNDAIIIAIGGQDVFDLATEEMIPLMLKGNHSGALDLVKSLEPVYSTFNIVKKKLERFHGRRKMPKMYAISIPLLETPPMRPVFDHVPGVKTVLQLVVDFFRLRMVEIFGADRVIDGDALFKLAVAKAESKGINVVDECMTDAFISFCDPLYCNATDCTASDVTDYFWLDWVTPSSFYHQYVAAEVGKVLCLL